MSAKYGNFDKDSNGNFVGTVYMYTLTTPGPWFGWKYIGSTTCELSRQGDWKNENNSYAGAGIEQGRKMFGLAAFSYTVIAKVPNSDADAAVAEMKRIETENIIKYDSVENGFNMTYGVGKKAVRVRVIDPSGVITDYPSLTDAGKALNLKEGSVRYWASRNEPTPNGYRIQRLS